MSPQETANIEQATIGVAASYITSTIVSIGIEATLAVFIGAAAAAASPVIIIGAAVTAVVVAIYGDEIYEGYIGAQQALFDWMVDNDIDSFDDVAMALGQEISETLNEIGAELENDSGEANDTQDQPGSSEESYTLNLGELDEMEDILYYQELEDLARESEELSEGELDTSDDSLDDPVDESISANDNVCPAGSLCVNPEMYLGDGAALAEDVAECIKFTDEDDPSTIYIDYTLESELTDEQRESIVEADPGGAFYINDMDTIILQPIVVVEHVI